MSKKKVEDLLSEDKQWDGEQASGVENKQASLAHTIVSVVKDAKRESLSEEERSALWRGIHEETQSRNSRRSTLPKNLVALFFLFVIGLGLYGYYVSERGNDIQEAAMAHQRHLSKSGNVQFIGADKKTQVLQDSSPVIYNQLSKLYKSSPDFSALKVRYSSIGVPYGKRSEVVLEDGTKVWLNAGSSLTFPEKFDNNEREVYLDGEAYFEIAKEAKRPFFVLSEVMKIQVLGTSFNLSSYADDDYTSLVLITGKVALLPSKDNSFEKQLLEPGMEARFRKSQHKLLIQPAAETAVSWTNRRLLLNSMNLDEILKKLERFYNADIEISERLAIDETFSGSFDLTQTLPEVLQNIFDVSKYSINQIGRRVYIQTK
ncbi:FecR family protein [Olivibacter sp. XZL3]|uniref:FecR family protein n=1 Tax=Olivibacter sp. XZL3 TaxID=1735116 RepID=UPI0010654262|nr:FecR domain-containing protein [Olivibacter sp. XZL3]